MRFISRDFFNATRRDEYRLVVTTDMHLGAGACDEARLLKLRDRIDADPNCLWLDLGDSLDCINVKDPRFDVEQLPEWISRNDLKDLSRVQVERFLDIFGKCAGKLIGKGKGNHEDALLRHSENDVHSRIISALKRKAGHPESHKLDLDYAAWLRLKFYRSDVKEGASVLTLYTHHGMGETKLKPWLYSHDCDLALFGHIHRLKWDSVAIEGIDEAGKERMTVRYGAYCGAFLNSNGPIGSPGTTYSTKRGMTPPTPGHIEVHIRPYASDPMERMVLTNGTLWSPPQKRGKTP